MEKTTLIELAIQRAMQNKDCKLSDGFDQWLRDNWSIYLAFEDQAHKVIRLGRKHYGAKTIIEYLRHQTFLNKAFCEKANDDYHVHNKPARRMTLGKLGNVHAKLIGIAAKLGVDSV